MLYYLFDYLHKHFDLPGSGVFQYISFRAAMAIITSLLISLIFGRRIIEYIRKKQVGETIRNLGLEGQNQKQGTPTMGGLIIIAAILIPTLLFAKLHNVYIILMLCTTIWLGTIGFLDDYIKVFKKDKEGLKGKFKVIGQIGLGLIVGITLYFNSNVVIKEKVYNSLEVEMANDMFARDVNASNLPHYSTTPSKSLKTTIPFVKNNEFNYSKLISFIGDDYEKWGWLVFIPIVILIITSVSNGANLTDGLDGLATGTSAIIGATLLIFAYVSGNMIFANYLNIMYIPSTGELVIFMGAFIGACVGFMWYNSYPAQVFMGDTGSLTLGGIIAVFALAIRKELLIPILCGIFLVENLSVVMQVSYFKYTKKKYGEGRRIFKMSPLHHHYQKLGFHESKIVTRFWIVGVMLAILTFVTLKLR
ncbi:MAG: phospho-N-acetylmuramoyl-pentapeptide-transferase [Bacteroidetes bacterium]|nr:phospho-N-acetylmuramoyl-pentapeptide-transferase [Bacteroidota bacterium]MBK9671409.1 phospho-N-acetylmuramoyl-pentapeptide-transferase [Bacteroidota bacterium]MBK9799366.1 phospho-N-acetylmuramoyl-pentapeptide-transferase [Bacteroidota bacterium]MBP6413377.1 phospho-N-acetylmuramoyl-pentapeptide-transferase [Bacteroidia bacterium]